MTYAEPAADTPQSCSALHRISHLSEPAAAVRAALLDGLSTVDDFAAGVGKSKRTVDQWIAEGLPTVRVGRTPYIPIAEAKTWLLKPRTRRPEARPPGRPRKAA